MATYRQTSSEYFRVLKIVHFALTMGQILFGIIAFAIVKMNGSAISDEFLIQVLYIIVPIFIIAAFIASTILFKKKIETAKVKNNLVDKMTEYRAAIILRLAPLEGSSFFSIIAYLITSNIIFLSLSALIILMFVLNQPTKEKAIADLELNFDEEKELNNPESIVSEYEKVE